MRATGLKADFFLLGMNLLERDRRANDYLPRAVCASQNFRAAPNLHQLDTPALISKITASLAILSALATQRIDLQDSVEIFRTIIQDWPRKERSSKSLPIT